MALSCVIRLHRGLGLVRVRVRVRFNWVRITTLQKIGGLMHSFSSICLLYIGMPRRQHDELELGFALS
jgi:hypothetical protein